MLPQRSCFSTVPSPSTGEQHGLGKSDLQVWLRAWSVVLATPRSSSCRRSRSAARCICPEPLTRAFKAVLAASAVGGIAAVGAYLVNHDNARRVASAAVSSESGSGGWTRAISGSNLRDFWLAFAEPVGVARTTTGLALIACVLGGIALMRFNLQRGLLVMTPIAVTLAASILDLYPFVNRFILFLVPFFLLLIGAGLDVLIRNRAQRRSARSAVLLVLSYPVARAATNLVSPPGHEELKAVLGDVQARWQRGDALYVWYQSQYPSATTPSARTATYWRSWGPLRSWRRR